MPPASSTFDQQADATLARLLTELETQDRAGTLELDEDGDGLTITLTDGKVLLLSRHRVAQEMWYASPRLGGLHFRPVAGGWILSDGRTLEAVLQDDLAALTGQTHWKLD